MAAKRIHTTDTVTQEQLDAYLQHLAEREKAPGTRAKYGRDLTNFIHWLDGRPLTKTETLGWKEFLQEGRSARTVNSMLSALNGFLDYLERPDCRVRLLQIQKNSFRSSSRDLSLEEFQILKKTAADRNKLRLLLILEVLCGLGLRISELSVITVAAVLRGEAEILKKGKVRTILITGTLQEKLLRYALAEGIQEGVLFRTRSGKPVSRGQIWAEMKALAEKAHLEPSKVFPHNLRHLFAVTFYETCPDLSALANILGHSNIQTTRIYLAKTGAEYRQVMDRLGLVD